MKINEILSTDFIKFIEFLKQRKIRFYFKDSQFFFESLLNTSGSIILKKSDYTDFESDYDKSNELRECENNWLIFITNMGSIIEEQKKNTKSRLLPILLKNKLEIRNNRYIFTKKISDIKFLLDDRVNEEIIKLLKFSTYESLREAIILPHKDTLANLRFVYIFGAQTLGEKIFEYCTQNEIIVLGFIDNEKKKQGMDFCGKKILSVQDCIKDKDMPVIIASITYLFEIYQQLVDLNFEKIIPYPLLSIFNEKKFPPEKSYAGMQRDLVENKMNYISFFLNLEDKKSRMVLNGLLSYRMSLDFHQLDPIIDPIINQNFEDDIFELSPNEQFVDGGAYNGDTANKFIQKVKAKYKEIILFEPDSEILERARKALDGYDRIQFLNKGLFSSNGTLNFIPTGGLGGVFSEKGSVQIPVVSLDNEIHSKITLLKLDVEGVEQHVLMGAKRHLQKESPKLAISGYHNCEDLWKLFLIINSINPNYHFYLRHYSHTTFETILYAK